MNGFGIRNASFARGGTTIIHGGDFHIFQGELCALIGPSGAGKSTLFAGLRKQLRPSPGSYTVENDSHLGFVPQSDILHRSLTAEEALTYVCELQEPGRDREDIKKWVRHNLRRVQLGHRADHPIAALSGGQRKRVSIAMELLNQPNALLLDEPTSGLDPGLENDLMTLFRDLAAKDRALMVSTHAMGSVIETCHLLLVIVAGYQAFFGSPKDALSYFDVRSLDDIFECLEKKAPKFWGDKYRASPLREQVKARARPLPKTEAPGNRDVVQPVSLPSSTMKATPAESEEDSLAELKRKMGLE